MFLKVGLVSKSKKLAIMDQDGANKYLTLGNELVLTPDLTQQIKW